MDIDDVFCPSFLSKIDDAGFCTCFDCLDGWVRTAGSFRAFIEEVVLISDGQRK